ncbi:NmrA family NAD(P)-binding protein [Flagellimonas sp.]|uniref:NmrA family NAD(P)-binding protein n=1 Tax=Flagellimonas sp. TaxID=2058762 RepID=UPI003F4A0550
MKNVLVLGGTGKTGRRIVERLQQQGHKVRIGSRGATPKFDWEDQSTWEKALEGMDSVYITYQPDLAVPGAKEAIEGLTKEAKKQGVEKLVLLSGKGEREAELCEEIVMNSGIGCTIVRASWFSQNFSESFFLDAIQYGVVALPLADTNVPYVDADDIAEVAVEALLSEKHNGEIYELTGSEFYTFRQVIQEIAKATDREIDFSEVSVEQYTQMLKEHGVPDGYVWLIGYLFTEVLDNEENQVMTHDVEKVLGRKPRLFIDFVKETAKTGVWNQKVEA